MRRVLVVVGFLSASCSPAVPDPWAEFHLPTTGLVKVYGSTDDNGFYADYSDMTPEELQAAVTQSLEVAGFTEACEAFDGSVRGFRRGEDELVVKVDRLGPVLGLSVFNEDGSEPLIHGACFGRLQLGPKQKIK